MPKQLLNSQRAERIRICKENLAKFESGVWRLCDGMTHGCTIDKMVERCQKLLRFQEMILHLQ